MTVANKIICAFCAFLWLFSVSSAQTLDLDTPDFKLRLTNASQTVAALEPKNTPGFDFTPSDRLAQRAANRYHHLGDLIVRVRSGNSGPWQKYDTAESRNAVESLTPVSPTLATADLSRTLPADIPLQIKRSWIVDNGRLVLRFELKNKTAETIQLARSACQWFSTTS
jgi:uncharacterized protein DUF5695